MAGDKKHGSAEQKRRLRVEMGKLLDNRARQLERKTLRQHGGGDSTRQSRGRLLTLALIIALLATLGLLREFFF
ncbi:MAG: hypothetical protein PHG44_09570 [Lentisphaeria bacterium]|jgi:hypothetical protein|nr:hypothetical protein [Lentisphaeria bacterium]NLZ59242.1 hypothetical protein [Lentisphaerota bacterium]